MGSSFEAYQAAVEAVQGFESCSILQNTEHSEITIFFFFMPKQHIFFIFFMCLFRSFFLHLSYSTIAFCLSPSLCLSLLINQSTSLRKWHLSRKKKTTCGAVKFWCRISTVHCASVQCIAISLRCRFLFVIIYLLYTVYSNMTLNNYYL